ncbi:hypothetical protein SCHPADRAFT_517279 [Schizopora paradoxa]|uniref:Uncharacterized protein n=1 Tax=Schizopora paradoxa TaxID=27342 RepID=A0A0H2RM06_9AGAM|nr:hypothetical protein SCHPADRAFT_517279 [Schizopora paradoxa]
MDGRGVVMLSTIFATRLGVTTEGNGSDCQATYGTNLFYRRAVLQSVHSKEVRRGIAIEVETTKTSGAIGKVKMDESRAKLKKKEIHRTTWPMIYVRSAGS